MVQQMLSTRCGTLSSSTDEWLVLFACLGPISLPLLPLGSHSKRQSGPFGPKTTSSSHCCHAPSPGCLGFSLSVSLTGGSLPPNPSGLHSPTVREDRWGAEEFTHSLPYLQSLPSLLMAPVPLGVALSTARKSLVTGPQSGTTL